MLRIRSIHHGYGSGIGYAVHSTAPEITEARWKRCWSCIATWVVV